MSNDDKYRAVEEKRFVYAVYGEDGKLLSEHKNESDAEKTIKRLNHLDAVREKAIATDSTKFRIGDRVRPIETNRPSYLEDIPAVITDIYCDTSPSDRGDCLYYRLKWDNGVANEFPTRAVELGMRLI